MRTPTSDHHFKDKIVRIILEILRYIFCLTSSFFQSFFSSQVIPG